MKPLSIAETRLTDAEILAAVSVLRSGQLRQGRECQAFEEEFAARVGAKYAVTCANGSAALHLAYMVCLNPGDEIIVPSFTFIATASMAVYAGVKPVFCDIESTTFLIDLNEAEKLISPKTKAIAPVHLFGNVCDVERVQQFAKEHDLRVIWDAAQAHGGLYRNRDVGSFDDLVCYSFYPTKNIFVGEGGMICTNNSEFSEKLRYMKSHGETGKYYHTLLGLNYRMTDVEAAIGRQQLKRFDEMLSARRQNAATLNAGIADIPGLYPQQVTRWSQHAWHQYTVLVSSGEFGCDRNELAEGLHQRDIGSAVHYPRGLHQQPVFERLYGKQSLPVTESVTDRILALPVHHGLDQGDAERIVSAVASLRR
jgi:perosamine synthetase